MLLGPHRLKFDPSFVVAVEAFNRIVLTLFAILIAVAVKVPSGNHNLHLSMELATTIIILLLASGELPWCATRSIIFHQHKAPPVILHIGRK